MTALGDKIAHRRTRLGLSVQDLAVSAGMTNRDLSTLEEGSAWVQANQNPRVSTLAALSRALGVSPLVLAAAAFDDLGCEFPALACEYTSAGDT
jgi:transcriptional regulator with XRE-family HTH domain